LYAIKTFLLLSKALRMSSPQATESKNWTHLTAGAWHGN